MEIMRNPKTGRFMSKVATQEFLSQKESATPKNPGKVKGKAPKVSVKEQNQKGEQKVQILINPLTVYSKKDLEGGPSNIKAGTEVILTSVGNTIRVKKTNSSRTFYTKQELVESAI